MTERRSIVAEDGMTVVARTLAASLPLSFESAPSGAEAVDGAVLLVAGDVGWAARSTSALRTGVRDIVVVDPCWEEPRRLRELDALVREHSARVVLSEGFSGNPAWDAVTPVPRVESLDMVGIARRSLSQILLDQVRLAGRIGIAGVLFDDVVVRGGAALAAGRGTVGDQTVLFRASAALTSARPPHVRVRAHTDDRILEAVLHTADTARPAQISWTGSEGATVLPSVYETAHRATLRRLRDSVGTDLLRFASDCELVGSLPSAEA